MKTRPKELNLDNNLIDNEGANLLKESAEAPSSNLTTLTLYQNPTQIASKKPLYLKKSN